MFRQSKRKTIILTALTALWLAFIWGNSLLPGDESGAISNNVGRILALIFGPWVQQATFLIRKLAHFSEFAILGFLVSWNGKLRQVKSMSFPILLGLLAAMTDETIQRFVPGRGSMVTDVWIDFSGILVGSAIIFFLWKRQKQ